LSAIHSIHITPQKGILMSQYKSYKELANSFTLVNSINSNDISIITAKVFLGFRPVHPNFVFFIFSKQ